MCLCVGIVLEERVSMGKNYLQDNSLCVSGLRKLHSKEKALVKVPNNLHDASDEGLISVLTLLGLSADIDTIVHSILLQRMDQICMKGFALR